MKTFISVFSVLIFASFSVNAKTNTLSYNNYGNAFIFVENGIEFSVFRDGQFDFNLLNNNPNFNASINTPNVSISFNNGYDYNPYLQYDEFGAIIQIENTPIFYDYYGRVNQVGNINIIYNNFGYISRVGGLYVHYNRFNNFSHCSGFINVYNRSYVYRPWHNYYIAPPINYCVVYNRPYRQYYTPVRCAYNTPYYNNYRPVTSVYNRRGDVIIRNRDYATINRGNRNMSQINTDSGIRRHSDYNKPYENNYTNTLSRNTRSEYNNQNRESRKTSSDNNAINNDSRRNSSQSLSYRESNTRTTQQRSDIPMENNRTINRNQIGKDVRMASVRRR